MKSEPPNLSRDEIPGLGLEQKLFSSLDTVNPLAKLLQAGFAAYDENLVYREYELGNRRYILAFNHQLFRDNRAERQRQLDKAREFLDQLNEELKGAKKSRDQGKLVQKIDARLRRLKLHKVISYELKLLELTSPGAKEQLVHWPLT